MHAKLVTPFGVSISREDAIVLNHAVKQAQATEWLKVGLDSVAECDMCHKWTSNKRNHVTVCKNKPKLKVAKGLKGNGLDSLVSHGVLAPTKQRLEVYGRVACTNETQIGDFAAHTCLSHTIGKDNSSFRLCAHGALKMIGSSHQEKMHMPRRGSSGS
jgi:hypothetical protein